jgi:hypothetical protein
MQEQVDSEDWFIEHFQRAVYETPKIECSLDTNCYSASRPIPVPFASALLMDLPLFWMDLTLFWPHASRVGYGHRWPFSLRILNKAVSRAQLVWREACPATLGGTNHSAI